MHPTHFFQLWWNAYAHPSRFAEGLGAVKGPFLGLKASLLRAALDSLLIFLPLHWMGRIPPTPSFLTLIPTESYYLALVWIAPLIFLVYWLFGSALTHVCLRAARLQSDMDVLLNLGGTVGLAIGTVLVVYDWVFILTGWGNQWLLGGMHLIIDGWGIAISVIAMKRLLGTPTWLGVLLNLLAIAAWMPFGIVVMRSPI
jgi:hypothetical protein